MPFNLPLSRQKGTKGFTLIEIIIGIVTLSIAFALIASLLIPASERSAAQIQDIRSAELGQSMLNEIFSKAFDHNSDMAGGIMRCGETGYLPCTSTLGPDRIQTSPSVIVETRDIFNDVDDYHGMSIMPIRNSLGEELSLYQGFSLSVDVSYACLNTACNPMNNFTKLITVTVVTPLGDSIQFARFKGNY